MRPLPSPSHSSESLTEIRRCTERAAALLQGPASIVDFIKTLPETRHPVAEADSDRNFVVDAFQLSGVLANTAAQDGGTVLFVTVHGQFKELPATGIRSFDRVFVLGVAGPATACVLASLVMATAMLMRFFAALR